MPGAPNSYGSRDDAAKGSFYKGTWYPSRETRKDHTRRQSEGELVISKAADKHKQVVAAKDMEVMTAMHHPIGLPVDVVDIPFHHPEEMQLIIAKVNDVVGREKAFPIKLHSQRVASDTAVTDMVNTFNDLVKLLNDDITDVDKIDNANGSAMREVVEVIKDHFQTFHNHVLQRDSTHAKDFEDYKKILTEQYGSAMALELANMHNGLSLWRHNFLKHHLQRDLHTQESLDAELKANRVLFSQLQQTHNMLTLRHGLLATEKKDSDKKLIDAQKLVHEAEEKERYALEKYADVEKQLEALKSKDKDASDKYAQALTEISFLKEQNKDKEAKATRVGEHNKRLQNEVNNVANKVKALDERVTNMATMELELKSSKTAYDTLKTTSEKQLKDAMQHYMNAQSVVKTNSDKLKEKDAEIASLKAHVEAKEHSDAIMKRLNISNMEDATRLLKKNEEIDENLRKVQQRNMELSKTMGTLKAELSGANDQKIACKSEKDALGKLLQTSGEKIAKLETDLATARQDASMKEKLQETEKKNQILAAENARVAFQSTADKAALEAEKKHLWVVIKQKDQDIERLEADVHRLATKVLAHGKNPTYATTPTKPITPEEPENFVFRKGAFDYDIKLNPNAPVHIVAPYQQRLKALEEELKIYRVITSEGDKLRNLPGIRSKLLKTGLFVGNPARTYVDPQWYKDVTNVGRSIYNGEVVAKKPEPEEPADVDETEMIEFEDIY